jgi:hypothetical protein
MANSTSDLQGSFANVAAETSCAIMAAKAKRNPTDIAEVSTTDELPSMSVDDLMIDSFSDDASECSRDDKMQSPLTNDVKHHEVSKSLMPRLLAGAEWLIVNRLSACCSSHELLSSTCA